MIPGLISIIKRSNQPVGDSSMIDVNSSKL